MKGLSSKWNPGFYAIIFIAVICFVLGSSPTLARERSEEIPSISYSRYLANSLAGGLSSVSKAVKGFIFQKKEKGGGKEREVYLYTYDKEELSRTLEEERAKLKKDFEESLIVAKSVQAKYNSLQKELSSIKSSGLKIEGDIIELKTQNLPTGQAGSNVKTATQNLQSYNFQTQSSAESSFLRTELSRLESSLQNINTNLLSKINTLSAQTSDQNSSLYRVISLTNKIDQLSNVTISNATVSGITGLTDSDIPNDITASNYLPLSGGTISGDLTVAGSATLATLTLQSATSGYFTATSSTASTFPYASTTAITSTTASTTNLIVSSNSILGTISSGLWNATAIGTQYGGTGLDSSALTGIAQIVAGTWSASSTLSTSYGGTGWNSIQSNSLLLGNGSGRLATTTSG
ncbi:hypothetical protein C4572_00760, partial [Candidatus Parcubacteria bacterium]